MFNQPSLTIRRALTSDAAAIQSIYRPYIEKTNYNLEVEIPSLESLRDRILTTSQKYPFLVAEYQGRVIGFVYLSDFYDFPLLNAGLLSIYLAEDAPIRGVGQELYTLMEYLLVKQGKVQHIISSIIADNDRSIRFHQKQGFNQILHISNLAHKGNDAVDVTWYHKSLAQAIPYMEETPIFDLASFSDLLQESF